MPTPFDISLVPAIKELIDENGVPATYIEEVAASYDPASLDGDNPIYSPTTASTAVVSTPLFSYDNEFVDGENIQRRDAFVFIYDYSGLVPEPGDQFLVDNEGQVWNVVNAKAYWTGDLIAAWELQLRKGPNRAN